MARAASVASLRKAIRPAVLALLEQARKLSPSAYLESARRSKKKQRDLYRAWRAGRSRFPAAVPGSSKHERGLAVDLGGLSSRQLAKLGHVWENWGGRWGGRFRRRDPIHFEA